MGSVCGLRFGISVTPHPDIAISRLVSQYRQDPLGYIKIAFPWGEAGGPLEHHAGPCPCQIRVLTVLGREIRKRQFDGHTPVKPIRIAVATGHGVGKSALFGMLDNYIRSTRPFCRGTVTATTTKQVHTKTWAAIQEWNRMAITGHWFEITSERAYRIGEKEKWFSQPQASEETNSEAFAGQHAANSTSYYLNDEVSGVPDKIFEVERGGLTDGEPMQFLFGNLTQPSGFFARVMNGEEPSFEADCRIRIDSRECPLTNKDEIADMIAEYGEDSDIVRVRVRGLAPRAGISQYFDDDLIQAARTRKTLGISDDPLIAGCDFAWGGDDPNTIRFRHGLDMWSIPPIKIPGEQTREPQVMIGKLAEVLTKLWPVGVGNRRMKVTQLFCDSAGIAGPVVIRLRQLGFTNVVECNFAAHSINPKYKNVRAMMIGELKSTLQQGGAIDTSKELSDDLRHIQVVNYVPLQFEEKKLLKKRLGRSTDDLDALALTHYMPVVLPSVQRQALGYVEEKPYIPASPYS